MPEPYLRSYGNNVWVILSEFRQRLYDPALTWTPDMNGLELHTEEWKIQAASQLNLNIVQADGGFFHRKNVMYVSMWIYNQIVDARWEVSFVLLEWNSPEELMIEGEWIRPMLTDGDKNICMYRKWEATKTQIEEETWKIYDRLRANLDMPENTLYEWVITWPKKVLFWNDGLVVEWYSKPHRVDKNGPYQVWITDWAQEVMGVLTDGDTEDCYPIFNFRTPGEYHHILPSR